MTQELEDVKRDFGEWLDFGQSIKNRIDNLYPCVIPEPTTAPSILNCGSVLTGSTETFLFDDPSQTATTIYDFWLGSAPGTDDIYDHDGGGVFNGLSITVNNIPTDGRTIYKTWFISRSGNFDDTETITCTCTAADIDQFKITADFGPDLPFGSVTEAMVDSWLSDSNGGSYNHFVESASSMSVVDGCLRIRFDPNTASGQVGSSRTITRTAIADSPCYCVEQTITLDNPFDYGGPPGNQTVKIGWGLGGGSVVTGGDGNDPCGWSFRWILRGNELRGYSYAFGRPAGTFGQDIPTGVIAQPGGTYDLKMKVCMNTFGNADGSYELYINGNLAAVDNNVLWMDHTQCPTESSNTINELLYENFYGGTNSNTQSWWPDSPQFITYCNPCITPTQS